MAPATASANGACTRAPQISSARGEETVRRCGVRGKVGHESTGERAHESLAGRGHVRLAQRPTNFPAAGGDERVARGKKKTPTQG